MKTLLPECIKWKIQIIFIVLQGKLSSTATILSDFKLQPLPRFNYLTVIYLYVRPQILTKVVSCEMQTDILKRHSTHSILLLMLQRLRHYYSSLYHMLIILQTT